MKIGFIGAGKMAEALAKGFVTGKRCSAKDIFASDADAKRLAAFRKSVKCNAVSSNLELVKKSSVVILSVKPQNLAEVLDEIAGSVSVNNLVVSICAGKGLAFIESKLKGARVVRVMPNLNCLVQEMAAAYSFGSKATRKDKKLVKFLLDSCGRAVEVSEEKMDAVTALSGSGPAFFAFVMRAFSDAAVESGLSEKEASLLAKQAMLGTGKIMLEKNLPAEVLIAMVASRGGTTEAGLKALEGSGVKENLREAIFAAVKRSRELGK